MQRAAADVDDLIPPAKITRVDDAVVAAGVQSSAREAVPLRQLEKALSAGATTQSAAAPAAPAEPAAPPAAPVAPAAAVTPPRRRAPKQPLDVSHAADDRTPRPVELTALPSSPHLKLRTRQVGGIPTGRVFVEQTAPRNAPLSRAHRQEQRMVWSYAIVLGSASAARERSQAHLTHGEFERQVGLMHQKVLRRLRAAGLHVRVLHNTRSTSDKAVVLVRASRQRLQSENRRQQVEAAILRGRATEGAGPHHASAPLSPALANMLLRHIIKTALTDFDVDLWKQGLYAAATHVHVQDVIDSCFPLHDRDWNERFFAAHDWRELLQAIVWDDPHADEQLRWHFGERVAYLFAFTKFYTRCVLLIALFGLLFYLAHRFGDNTWGSYVRGLSVLGLLVCAVWAPLTVLGWKRRSHWLQDGWCAQYERTCMLADLEDANEDFQFEWRRNMKTGRMEKHAEHWKKCSRLVGGGVMMLFSVLQVVLLVPFIHWYVWAKNAPDCSEVGSGQAFEGCFTGRLLFSMRWFYILLQGIVLGLLIDVVYFQVFLFLAKQFVAWENLARQSEFEKALISRAFIFIWPNWFFWFLAVALVWGPYGSEINTILRGIEATKGVTTEKYNPNWLSLDTTFVTPLIVTQALNLLIENYVPSLLQHWEEGRCCCCPRDPDSPLTDVERRHGKIGTVWIALQGCFACVCGTPPPNHAEDGVPQKRTGTAQDSDLRSDGDEPAAEADNDDDSAYDDNDGEADVLDASALAQACGVELMERSGDSNDLDATAVLLESKRNEYDPFGDYLDMMIQFSYVTMFYVVWPLIGVCAFVNNVLEYQGDIRRLLFIDRRPLPKRDHSIGGWELMLYYESILACVFVPGIIVMYHLGYWDNDCSTNGMPTAFGDRYMIPWFVYGQDGKRAFPCYNAGLHAKIGFIYIALEHVTLFVRFLVSSYASEVPKPVRERREAAARSIITTHRGLTRDSELSKGSSAALRARLESAESNSQWSKQIEDAEENSDSDFSNESDSDGDDTDEQWLLERAALRVLFNDCAKRSFLPPPRPPGHLATATSPMPQSAEQDATPVSGFEGDAHPLLDERGFVSLLCAAFALPMGSLDWAGPMAFRYADKQAAGRLPFDDVALLVSSGASLLHFLRLANPSTIPVQYLSLCLLCKLQTVAPLRG